jgi:hypothetical protein
MEELYERFEALIRKEANKPNALFLVFDRILCKRHFIYNYLALPVINLLLVVAKLLSWGGFTLLILWSSCRWQSNH